MQHVQDKMKNVLYELNIVYRFINNKNNNTQNARLCYKSRICNKCGDYSGSRTSDVEKIYCKCVDAWGQKCLEKHKINMQKVFYNIEIGEEMDDLFTYLYPSTYSHPGNCFPDSRTCNACYRYWCGRCGGGMGSYADKCNDIKCGGSL